MTDLYLRLDYKEYKHLESQLRNWELIETSHTTVDGFYHKALRLDIGDLCLEIQGPAVREPVREASLPLIPEGAQRLSPSWYTLNGELRNADDPPP